MKQLKIRASRLNIYSKPKETKNCVLCNKEIDKKWSDDLCLLCRDKLKLYPDKLKDISEIFKINKYEKPKGEENKMAKKKQNSKTNEETEDKKIYVIFHKSELPKLGLKTTAKARELANYLRKKVGLPELTTIRSSKKRLLIEKLGLDEDASQKDINDAMAERLEEE